MIYILKFYIQALLCVFFIPLILSLVLLIIPIVSGGYLIFHIIRTRKFEIKKRYDDIIENLKNGLMIIRFCNLIDVIYDECFNIFNKK